jgi:hypothetical protein
MEGSSANLPALGAAERSLGARYGDLAPRAPTRTAAWIEIQEEGKSI